MMRLLKRAASKPASGQTPLYSCTLKTMLYNLIKTEKGKDSVVMTDQLPKVKNRMDTLRKSQRKKNILYKIVPTTETNKFRQKPHDGSYVSGDYPTIPRRIK